MSVDTKPECLKTAPAKIYLQASDDVDDYEVAFPADGDCTWCADPVLDCEIEYIRADLARPVNDQLLAALREVISISDRDHDAWRRAKAAIVDAELANSAIGVQDAVTTVICAMQMDPAYLWSWHCSIAVAAQDEGLGYEASQRVAQRFLQLFAGVDSMAAGPQKTRGMRVRTRKSS